MNRTIWQYWETGSFKPLFVEELLDLAIKNSGVEVIQVTPENLQEYLPEIPKEILRLKELAHKADMIRVMLLNKYGGMWLDSDAIVLKDLNWLFDLLKDNDFVGFNDSGDVSERPLNVRINCFLSKPNNPILIDWTEAQHAKLDKTQFEWTEVGTDLLNPIVIQHSAIVKLLPFSMISPVSWRRVKKFSSTWQNSRNLISNSHIVMLSNKALEAKNPELRKKSIYELSQTDTLIGDIINSAIDKAFVPKRRIEKLLKKFCR